MRFLALLLLTIGVAAAVADFPGHSHAYEQGTLTQRSPCPGLNTLANHGFIQRDGTDIPVEDAVSAIQEVFGLEKEFTRSLFDQYGELIKTLEDGNGTNTEVFNLFDLYNPGSVAFDHDGSLFRRDPYHGPFPQFDHKLFDELVALAEAGYITRQVLGKHQHNRVVDSKKNNPEALYNQIGTMSLESTVFFLFGNDSVPDTDLERVCVSDLHSFVGPNRIPEGWRPRADRGLPLVSANSPAAQDAFYFFSDNLLQAIQTSAAKYEQACLGTYQASGFDVLRTDMYDQWLDENSTLQLAQTGKYQGPENSAEYVNFLKSAYFDYYVPPVSSLANIYPVSYKEDECEILTAVLNRAQTNKAVVGQALCAEFLVGAKIKFTVKGKFYVEQINVFYSGPFISFLFGNALNTDGKTMTCF
jgi:hypothetical protein